MLIIVMLLGAGAVYMVLRKIYAALWYKNLTVRIDFSKKNALFHGVQFPSSGMER